jgi:predicted transcriptional regulator
MSGPDIVMPAQTRVLLALIAVCERDGRATVRSVATEVGRAVRTTYDRLLDLRDVGLVDWEEGKAGTLRPTVRRVA